MTRIADPKFDVGDVVNYVDRQDRPQVGRIRRIEASWSWKPDREPLITYTIEHPTYRNQHIHIGREKITTGGRA